MAFWGKKQFESPPQKSAEREEAEKLLASFKEQRDMLVKNYAEKKDSLTNDSWSIEDRTHIEKLNAAIDLLETELEKAA